MEHKNSQTGEEKDLFGLPLMPIRDRRGRPSFRKTKENQDFVAVRAAAGWTHLRIAQALGCNDDTLRKHFSGELENGYLIIEGIMLDVLMHKIRDGHTPSIRLMQDRIEDAAPTAPRSKASQEEHSGEPDPEIGKKGQALLDAQVVPDDWGDIDARRKH